MQCDFHAARSFDEPFHGVNIYVAFGSEHSRHNAFSTGVFEKEDFFFHFVQFPEGVKKVPITRTYEDTDRYIEVISDHIEKGMRRSRTSYHEVRTKLQPVGARADGRVCRCIRIHAGFERSLHKNSRSEAE